MDTEVRVQAGIELYERSLRYAEVEVVGSRFRLLRLGSCDFDFEVARQLLSEAEPAYLDTVAEALGDVFSGSSATSFRFALHPTDCYSFLTPFPADLTPGGLQERIEQELGLVLGENLEKPVRFSAEPVRSDVLSDGRGVEWYHILAAHEHVHERLRQVLPQKDYRLKTSVEGAVSVLAHLCEKRKKSVRECPELVLAIGWYPSHVEYILIRDGRWQYSQFADVQSPNDTTYIALVLLKRLQLTRFDIDQLYLYGTGFSLVDPTLLEKTFEAEVNRLDPLEVITLESANLASVFDADAYVPCIGVALD